MPVRSPTGADADGRNFQLLGDQFRDAVGNGFKFQHETARVLNGQRVVQNLHRRFRSTALDFEPTEHRHGVWSQADVRGSGNARVDERFENVGLALATLGFDGVATASLHQPGGVFQCQIDRAVALIRHAAEHERVGRPAANRLTVHGHHVHRGWHGGTVAVSDHRQTITDDGHIDARRFSPTG